MRPLSPLTPTLVFFYAFTSTGCEDPKEDGEETSTTAIASAVIGAGGGSIEVTDAESPLYGLRLDVPPEALDHDEEVTIIVEENGPSSPVGFHALDYSARLEPTGLVFNDFVVVSAPTRGHSADSLVVGHYSSGEWSIPPLLGLTDDDPQRLVFLIDSFSTLSWFDSFSAHETGFEIDQDTYPINNFDFNGGVCWSISAFSQRFYTDLKEDTPLRTAYSCDTAEAIAVELFAAQDEWWYDYFVQPVDLISSLYGLDDSATVLWINAGLALGKPQLLAMQRSDDDGGHTVLVTASDLEQWQVYDPNDNSEFKAIDLDGELSYGSYDLFYSMGVSSLAISSTIDEIWGSYSYDGPCEESETDPNDTDDDGDGYTENEEDCDDADATSYTGASEDCSDGADNDCDGYTDDEDSDCSTICSDVASSTVYLYIDGSLEATISLPSFSGSIEIQLGARNALYDNVELVVDCETLVSEDFEVNKGCFDAGSISTDGNPGDALTTGSGATYPQCPVSSFDPETQAWYLSFDSKPTSSTVEYETATGIQDASSGIGIGIDTNASGSGDNVSQITISGDSESFDFAFDSDWHTFVLSNYANP